MKTDRFELYRALTLLGWRWYWRLRAANGEIVASGEGYRRREDAARAIEIVCDTNAATPLKVLS